MTKSIVGEIFVKEENKFLLMSHGINHDANNSSQSEQQKHKQHQQNHQSPISKQYNVNLHSNPVTPEVGRPTKLIFSITEQRSGDPIREYEFVHDKLMHLIIVNEDLSYFAHIHPTLGNNRENFTIVHTFPEAGKYKLWVDFKPKDGNQTLVSFMEEITGNPTHIYRALEYDGKYTKQTKDRGYRISLKLHQDRIVANKDVDIVFSVSDAIDNPVMDLEPLMKAGGHSVIISSTMQEFLHVHPREEVEPN